MVAQDVILIQDDGTGMAKQGARSYPDPSGWDLVSSSVELEKKKLLLVVIICC